jgi:hypothetical protein
MRELAREDSFAASGRSVAALEKSIQAALRGEPAAVKEEAAMKRKMSFALVFVLTLILLAGMALAIATFRETGRQIVEIEQQEGFYAAWTVEKKAALAMAVIEQGYAERTPETEGLFIGSLSPEEAGRIADGVLVAFTGREVSEISFMEIMIAAWGPFEQWSTDEQAWYSQLMVEMGLQGEDHTLYVQPRGPVDEAQAVAIARREIANAYGVPESALDAYTWTTSFQVPEFAEEGDDQPYWYVEYWTPENMPESEQLFPHSFWVFIHPETGALLEPASALKDLFQPGIDRRAEMELTMEVATSFQQVATSFGDRQASLKDMVAFRQAWEPRLEEITRASQAPGNEAYSPEFLQNMVKLIPQIGLPQAGDISEAEALEKAWQCAKAIPGFSREQLDALEVSVAAYLTPEGPDAPVYHFTFSYRKIAIDSDAEYDAYTARLEAYYAAFGGRELAPHHISVRIDGRTGAQIGETRVLYDWPIDHEVLLLNLEMKMRGTPPGFPSI